jgi:hypothetical protein
MEWIFWLIVVAAAVYWLFVRNKPNARIANAPTSSQVETTPKLTISVSATTGRFRGDGIKIGYQPTGDGGFVIGPTLPFPVTLYGTDEAEVTKLVTAFEQGEDYEIGEWFTHLVAHKNVRCKELDEWIGKARANVREQVKQRVLTSTEWVQASELDKKDLLIEIQDDVVEELAVRPADLEATRTLLLEEPRDLTVDDALLERFKDNPRTYQTLLYAISCGTKVQIAPAGDYRRKTYDELYEKGFMRRGQEIPIEDILMSMTMKQMQEIAGADAPKKFTRKAHAIDFVKGLSDIQQRLEKAISFRELFQVKPIDGVDVDDLAKAHTYSSQVARVVLRTTRASVDSQRQRESRSDEYVDGWELSSEDCCPSCRAQHGKTWKRLPQKLPPFHMGCEARLYSR